MESNKEQYNQLKQLADRIKENGLVLMEFPNPYPIVLLLKEHFDLDVKISPHSIENQETGMKESTPDVYYLHLVNVNPTLKPDVAWDE